MFSLRDLLVRDVLTCDVMSTMKCPAMFCPRFYVVEPVTSHNMNSKGLTFLSRMSHNFNESLRIFGPIVVQSAIPNSLLYIHDSNKL